MPDLLPDAVLLDLDGTLADSEPLWSRATAELAARHGAPWDDATDGHRIVGWAIPDIAALLVARGVALPSPVVEEWLNDRVAALMGAEPPWRPGATALLGALVDAGVPTALVTMTYRRLATTVRDAAPPGALAVVVAGDDVRRGKPDPEAYLTAAAALGADPARCVAVEDSVTGVTAALAAGALTYAVQPATVLPAALADHPRLRRVDGLPAVAAALGLSAAGR